MQFKITPKGATATQRLATWRDQVAENFVEMNFKTDVEAFDACLSGYGGANGFALIEVSGRAQEISREAASLAKAPDEHVFFLLGTERQTKLLQGRNEAIIRPEEFTFLDATRPYVSAFEDVSSRTMLQVPRLLLSERLGPHWEDLVATKFSNDQPLERLAAGFLRSLAHVQAKIDADSRDRLFRQALDLLAVPLAQKLRLKPNPSTHRSVMLFRLKRFIIAHLRDEDLSIEKAANAFGISPRYVNMLLGLENTSFGRFVLQRRLEGCRRDLEAGDRTGLHIGEIAYQWGFRDASVFGRAFKARFDLSPRDCRKTTASGRSRS